MDVDSSQVDSSIRKRKRTSEEEEEEERPEGRERGQSGDADEADEEPLESEHAAATAAAAAVGSSKKRSKPSAAAELPVAPPVGTSTRRKSGKNSADLEGSRRKKGAESQDSADASGRSSSQDVDRSFSGGEAAPSKVVSFKSLQDIPAEFLPESLLTVVNFYVRSLEKMLFRISECSQWTKRFDEAAKAYPKRDRARQKRDQIPAGGLLSQVKAEEDDFASIQQLYDEGVRNNYNCAKR
jgi:hypothetical protein